jgi:hypothetical protein
LPSKVSQYSWDLYIALKNIFPPVLSEYLPRMHSLFWVYLWPFRFLYRLDLYQISQPNIKFQSDIEMIQYRIEKLNIGYLSDIARNINPISVVRYQNGPILGSVLYWNVQIAD